MRVGQDQRVILGPPGCGKTSFLLKTLDEQLSLGTEPNRIAYFSFTRTAVEEARTRASNNFDLTRDELVFFRTIHSMVFALNGTTKKDVIGKEHYSEIAHAIGTPFGAGMIDESTGMPMGNDKGDVHLFVDNLARARCVPLFDQWQDADLQDVDFRDVERTVAAVKRYKDTHGLVDFTDMLERYVENGRPIDVDVAFVDEAQDLSLLQWKVLQRMLSACPRVYIAGDDDQAIYRWSGADVSSFLDLAGDRQVLNRSWRCPQQVHKLADRISSKISQRFEKHWSPKDERGSITRVNMLEGFDLTELEGSTLLLARNTYLLKDYTDQLRKRGLPYLTSYGQHSVLKGHAKAIYAWGRLRKGEAVLGSEAKAVYDQLRVGVGVKRGFKTLPNLENNAQVTETELRSQHGLVAPEGPWFDVLDGIAGKDIGYYRSILRGKRSLIETPHISVNTVHGVKGGEADNVFVNPDMAWRSYRQYEKDPDDEHRVAYVAVSRAKSKLFLLSPRTKNFYRYLE